MLFCCGIASGTWFFAGYEPLKHYTDNNRYSFENNNTKAQDAINQTLLH